MRISDWSSDVCSSDLIRSSGVSPEELRPFILDGARSSRDRAGEAPTRTLRAEVHAWAAPVRWGGVVFEADHCTGGERDPDRKSVVEGTSGSVRVDLGGRRIIKKKLTKRKRHRE